MNEPYEHYLTNGVDLRIPLHARAYLKAASHYLSSWPQDWSAERLSLAIMADEDEPESQALKDRKEVKVWEALDRVWENLETTEDAGLYVETMIANLAEDFILFK
jgi:hypothetical protein